MTFGGLHIARTGLAASQRALDVIGHNIANVATDGHTRQRLQQVSTERNGPNMLVDPGAYGTGVKIVGVERVRDLVLDGTVRSELSSSAGADVAARTLGQIEAAIGPLEGGLGDSLTAFWNGWEELSLDPTSMTARNQVLSSAETLAHAIREASLGVDAVVEADHATASTMLEEQNGLIAQVADLNEQIRAQLALGENPAGLQDQRDNHLDALASTLGARVRTHTDGSVNVSVNGFEVVRGGSFSTLSITGTPPTLETSDGHRIVPGGTIGALVLGSQASADQVKAELDVLAVALRDTVNTEHQLGFDLSGAAGGDVFTGTGAGDLLVAAGLTAAALAASVSGETADGNHAIAMAGLRDRNGPDGTIDEQARALIGRVGSAVRMAQSRAELDAGVLTDVKNARSAVSGVNIDEELTMLLQYQRAYEASARVLTSVDEMLDVLVNRTGIVGR